MAWVKVVTRNYFLLESYYTLLAYTLIPDFSFKNVLVISNDNVMQRYLNKTELEHFYNFIRKHEHLKEKFKEALKIDEELRGIIKKDPLKNFYIFHKKYLDYWSYSLLDYYVGLALTEEQIKPFKEEVEFLRGSKSIVNEIRTKFFPKLLKKLESKTGIPKELAGYYFPKEITDNKIVSVPILEKRKEYYVWLIKNGKINFYTGNSARKIEQKELGLKKEEKIIVSKIKGKAAYPGLVRGRVRIINSVKETIKLKTGEILVTSMTMPEFIPVMSRVKAIITDEGGLTCHAAIVSREMKIPCIVGTKISTKVLKEGDLVEVDACKGTIRKITTT